MPSCLTRDVASCGATGWITGNSEVGQWRSSCRASALAAEVRCARWRRSTGQLTGAHGDDARATVFPTGVNAGFVDRPFGAPVMLGSIIPGRCPIDVNLRHEGFTSRVAAAEFSPWRKPWDAMRRSVHSPGWGDRDRSGASAALLARDNPALLLGPTACAVGYPLTALRASRSHSDLQSRY